MHRGEVLLRDGVAVGDVRSASYGHTLGGAVGLHGGLVGGWFALQHGLLQISATTPAWLIGAGGSSPNPIGGLLSWLGLAALLWGRRRWWGAAVSPQP
jgi:hypothetical protein